MTAVIPPPPLDLPLNVTGQTVLTVVTSVAAVGFVLFTARLCGRLRSGFPAVITLSGFVCLLLEPIYDNQFHIWFHAGPDQWGLYSAYGMTQPIWVPITYVWCYGGLALLVWRRVRAGISRAGLVRFTGVLCAIFTAFELIGINLGVYTYYGPQAVRVFGLPIWVEVANTVLTVVAGVAFARLESLLVGWRRLCMLAVVPASFAMVNFGTAFPALVVMSRVDPPTPLLWTGAIVSVGFALCILQLAVLPVPVDGLPQEESDVGTPAGRSPCAVRPATELGPTYG